VLRSTPTGEVTVVHEAGERPSGLGFLPDGTPIVVLMQSRQILRLGSQVSVHSDLAHIPAANLNDMVVGPDGRAYVDCLQPRPTMDSGGDVGDAIVLVEPDGAARIVAQGDLVRPNGIALTPDGGTLVVAEAIGRRLSAFSVDADGSLRDRRLFADIRPRGVDGMCLDAEGCAWIASPRTHEFARVRPGGAVTDTVSCGDRHAIACVLGGEDRRTLLMLSAAVPDPPTFENLYQSRGRVEVVDVAVPGAGWP
jgi:sugar lactone lactonase YvrE